MNAKTLMIALAAFAVGGVAHAITSDEIAAALDTNVGTYSLSGESEWFIDSSSYHDGITSMRSGALSTAGSTTRYSNMLMSFSTKETARLSMWVRTSCYDNTSYNSLTVTCDDDSRVYCGEKAWFKISFILLPGVHTVQFKYMCYYRTSGSNCAWVDNIQLESLESTKTSVEVSDIKCVQRYPWNGMVDIDYTVTCDKQDADIWVFPVGYDKDSDTVMAPRALSGEGVNAPVKAGTHRMTWKVTDDYPGFNSTAITVKMTALIGAAPYMVVDLSGGVDAMSYPVSYLSSVPAGGWGQEYKTTKLVLRLIPSGHFMMGSPSDENGRGSYETLRPVILTKPFYIGVFECTQKQYELVMGATPSSYKGDARPVESVSYNNIRGSVNGKGWPTHNQVDANSFMGRLRSKANMLFDLPSEAQWEYACRAGTSSALNSGLPYSEQNLKVVARCSFNKSDGKGGYTSSHTTVGSYQENAWGLYDMHGNVWEFCCDYWHQDGLGTAGVVDPKGSSFGYYSPWSTYYDCRIYRGGSYSDNTGCRSAYRNSFVTDFGSTSTSIGFRVFCSPVAQ